MRHADEGRQAQERRRRVEQHDEGDLERRASEQRLAHVVDGEHRDGERRDEPAVDRLQQGAARRQEHDDEQKSRDDHLDGDVLRVVLEKELAAHPHEHREQQQADRGDKGDVEEGAHERDAPAQAVPPPACEPDCLAGRSAALSAHPAEDERKCGADRRTRHEHRDGALLGQGELGPADERRDDGRGRHDGHGVLQGVPREHTSPGEGLHHAADSDEHARRRRRAGRDRAEGHQAEQGVPREVGERAGDHRRAGAEKRAHAFQARQGGEGEPERGCGAQLIGEHFDERRKRVEALERHGRGGVEEHGGEQAGKPRHRQCVARSRAPRRAGRLCAGATGWHAAPPCKVLLDRPSNRDFSTLNAH